VIFNVKNIATSKSRSRVRQGHWKWSCWIQGAWCAPYVVL